MKKDVIEQINKGMSLNTFRGLLPPEIDAETIFNKTLDKFEEDEAIEVLAEIAITVTAECDRDDFHSWNYDHLEYIIELSNEVGFLIPENLINGLPEQLIILVDSDKIDRECE
jgi:hypothetical protein